MAFSYSMKIVDKSNIYTFKYSVKKENIHHLIENRIINYDEKHAIAKVFEIKDFINIYCNIYIYYKYYMYVL